MTNTCMPATQQIVQGVFVITSGANVEPRPAFLRQATPADKSIHGSQTKYMIDRCPGCREAIPAIPSKLQRTLIIAKHHKHTPSGETVCSYGGEPLDLQGNCPP